MKYRHIYKEFQAIGKGGGSDSERWKDPPPPAPKGHFYADCSSANILNTVRLWNKIN